jgi:hypothetical protein
LRALCRAAFLRATRWRKRWTKREYKNRIWALVDVDLSQLEDVTERINITLPRRVLTKLDAAARAAGESRSGYIAHLALSK